ncbi:hypothetical protein BT67DRAFT_446968 [Trichocladium antarcticum]|uniref:Uncharacterized protein n=1 Tax=Trichocladium antarcticum TaxID=1450529 RepID=A0AAN6UU67_9PEZI|nr:hypothetical protein BT67DRAFT_446968 [Trichocladium antarcticum]
MAVCDDKRGGGHHSGSAPTTSRAVSTTDSKEYPGPSPFSPSAIMMTRGMRHPSPRTLSRVSLINRHSGSSDEIEESPSRGLGERPMAGHSDRIGGVGLDEQAGPANAFFHDKQVYATSAQKATFTSLDFTVPRQFSRPPPPPPLIPPTRSAAVFPFEDRCPSYAVSIHPGVDRNFIHQPNPEYSGCSTSTDVLRSTPPSPTALPRRRSYAKNVPIGIPIPATTTSFASSPETVALRGTSAFFYASHPPTSPLHPPPPPPEYVFVGGPGGPGVFLPPQEIGLQGEIISVMDDAGQGWKRHTRVYGGGACLACVAARERGEGQGGFYGDTVPLADRR